MVAGPIHATFIFQDAMAKLTLNTEDLLIESFQTNLEKPLRGTVLGAESLECPDPWTFYNWQCCSTHETACEGATCVVLSHCCPSNAHTCQASCACGPSAYCGPTDVC